MNKYSLIIPSLACFLGNAILASERGETVVLLHGILNRPFVMKKIQKALEKEGYRVINWGYESREKTIEEYSADLDAYVQTIDGEGPIHFVGFSLGSIIERHYLAGHPPPRLGRFVQIAPPNHGSEKAETLYEFNWFRWIYGDKAIKQLRSGSDFLKTCGTPHCPIGIIVGGRGDDRGVSDLLPGDDDGAVSLESSRLDGMTDFVQINSRHTLLLAKDETARQATVFLRTGRFEKNSLSAQTKSCNVEVRQ